ncbi:response regulator transcription factor [Variovorax sp. J22P168]|uniref:response regulator transcription factor n=1 Tax=Variovorax jilinensis TaxID=3053513 RepID=UPI00257637F2|nr:response regulator transcription factor [Variovorax sp. J22P168]MDM0011583.1 response regulator transcription factor [Variovorax sp. J22P168]
MHTVIVVDDHPAIRLAVRSALEATGNIKVIGESNDGPSALAAIRELRPDLVILDLDLPRLSGLDLIDRVRKSQPATRLLVLSAQQESIFASRTVQAGANGFMSKSENMAAVVQAVQTVLAGYSMFPSSALSARAGSGTAASGDALLNTLSDRELTVLQYLARGLSNKEIAETLLISNKTISSYKTRIFEKLGISTLVELVDFTRARNIVS